MKKRIVALSLASVLALTSITTTACKKQEEQKEVEFTIDIDIPRFDGGGEDFDVFISYSVANLDFQSPEEETGDTINDILYRRNMEVQNYFNVKFNVSPGASNNSELTPTIRNLIQAGDDTYEVFINVQHVGIPLIYDGLFVDWNTYMPHNDLSQPWWYNNVIRDLNFSDKVYVTAGAYNYHCLRGAGALAFNKTMMDELKLDYPYELVKNGAWTIDKFIEYIKVAADDVNGDGKMTFDQDRYGIAGWQWEMMPAFYVGMGGQNVIKDENNLPVLNINTERNVNIINKMLEVFKTPGSLANSETYSKTGTMFKEGRLMFHDTTLDQLPGYREMDDDFGAIPYPKLDKDQEDYYSRVVNYSSLTYIPVTNAKLELTSAILEAMAYLSYRDLIPEFYNIILTVKTTRDTETEEMIDIIREGARFMDENYLGSGSILNMVNSGSNTLSSTSIAQRDAWNIKLANHINFWQTAQ